MTNEVAKARAELKMTRSQFAAEIGVVRTTVMRWEKGEASPSRYVLLFIQDLMKRHRAKKTSKPHQSERASA